MWEKYFQISCAISWSTPLNISLLLWIKSWTKSENSTSWVASKTQLFNFAFYHYLVIALHSICNYNIPDRNWRRHLFSMVWCRTTAGNPRHNEGNIDLIFCSCLTQQHSNYTAWSHFMVFCFFFNLSRTLMKSSPFTPAVFGEGYQLPCCVLCWHTHLTTVCTARVDKDGIFIFGLTTRLSSRTAMPM